MKKSKLFASLVAGLVLLAAQLSLQAQSPRTGDDSGPSASAKGGVAGPTDLMDYQADLFTGRFGYQVPMPLAPGRHDSAPSVSLEYNSANANGWCGVGWNLDFGYIQRQTKYGVPVVWSNGLPVNAYDDGKGFVFSLKGKGSTLVNVTNWQYRSEIESGFLRFQLLTNLNEWQVTDTSGNQYFFGTNAASRMGNAKSGWSSNAWNGTFRWALTRVQTAQGDTIDYTYTNYYGTLYPLQISYNGHTNGVSDSATVDFILGTRNDVSFSYASGYFVGLDHVLNAVVHKVSGQVVWSNRLAYAQSPSTQRSLLQSVTRFGTNLASSLPPLTFSYTVQQFGFQPIAYWTNLSVPDFPNSSSPDPDYYNVTASGVSITTGATYQFADLLDMDGDGLPDRVYTSPGAPYTSFAVQHNNGAGFDNPILFSPLSVQTYAPSGYATSNQVDWDSLNAAYSRLLDINGDGLPDVVADPVESLFGAEPFTRLAVQLNNGTNWASPTNVNWTNVMYTNIVSGATVDYRAVERQGSPQVVMVDLNGDGLPDRLLARQQGLEPNSVFTNYWVQFNTGAGFTAKSAFGFQSYDEPYGPGTYGGVINSPYVRLIDLNGDGLPDRVMYPINGTTGVPEVPGNVTSYVVEFNNGYGFEAPVYWSGVQAVYTNGCGTSLIYPEAYQGIQTIQDTDECALRDINGDGLPDRIYRYDYCDPNTGSKTNWMVQINLGGSFAPPVPYGPYYSQGQTTDINYTGIGDGTYTMLLDIDGDGIPDHVMRTYGTFLSGSPWFSVELSKGPLPDLLNLVSNGMGGTVALAYVPSTKYNNHQSTNGAVASRNLLPFPVPTVSAVSVADGLYPSNTTTYAYQGGKWDATRREFDGFAQTTVTDPLGLKEIHWFHQAGGRDNSTAGEYQDTNSALGKLGMEFRRDTVGSDGQEYKLVLNRVEDASLGSGSHFGYVSQTLALDYPAGNTNTYRATARQFARDLSNGNLTNTVNFGEVSNVVVNGQTFTDVAGDTVYQATAYAALANTNILDLPQHVLLTTDSSNLNVLRETLYTYDGNTGNLLQQLDRMCPTCYVTNTYAYDAYNNRTSATNEAGIVTGTGYESTYQTFPVSQTVGGSFTSAFAYDARSGKLLTSTDPKGLAVSNNYDAFLRLVETDVSTTPYSAPSEWLARYNYGLGMAGGVSTNFVRIRKNDGVDSVNGHETWTYSDGNGRVLQVRQESETNGFRVTDTVYDQRGGVQFVTLPYFSSGTNFTKPSGTEMGVLNGFDAAGRPNRSTNGVNGTFNGSGLLTGASATGGDTGSPLSNSIIAYANGNDPWTLVLTDELGKVHRYSLDAYGRTNQIVEVTSGGNFTTTLAYNLAGDLTNITDNAANQIQYAYNNLGQQIAMADPDMGVWFYERDYAGRLREQIDADGQRIQFNYDDALGRLHTRQVYDYTGTFAYGVTNIYDSSDDGNFTVYPGQLYKVIDSQGWQKNSYDVRGRALKTARYLTQNSMGYTNSFQYDDQDRVTQTVYPNGGPTITNIFDTGGNLSQVQQVGGSGTVYYAARGFNALDQPLGVNFGNGVVTTNNYFTNSHRLQQVVTFKSGGTNLQNLAYTYDQVANIKSINDTVYATNASATLTNLVYDDLHRLTSLTRPAISQTVTFGYNSIGNITASGENGGGAYTYGTRMPHAVKSANGVNYAYDQNGNMLVRGNQRLSYDPENRLSYVVTSNSYVMFGYDAGGTRLWKQSSGTNGLQVWIGGNYEEKNGQILFHVLAGGQTVCTFDKTGTGEFAYYHPDNLGSTAIETDASGSPIQHYEYSAFGQSRYTLNTTAFPVTKRFTGQSLDDETGLYYYGNYRYYDPQLGRFVQADNIISSLFDPQSFNRYSYVRNNPLRFTDPNGHEPWEIYYQNYSAQQMVEISRAAAPGVAGLTVAVATGGAATPLLVSAGASTAFAAVGSGLIAGAAGDLAAQGTQIALGQRNSISGQEIEVSALAGGALNLGFYGVSRLVSVNALPEVVSEPTEPAVHRVITPGKPQFQLRKGEEGLSVFDASKVSTEDVLPHFREGSQTVTKPFSEIESHGLTVQKTPGDPSLPQHLQDAHMEITKPTSMSRDQFKQAIKKLEPKSNE